MPGPNGEDRFFQEDPTECRACHLAGGCGARAAAWGRPDARLVQVSRALANVLAGP
ncbi:MAG: hypothetical protein KKA60_03525 [Proteobacteria bacterium]|nr:hypothetical protein [Pseudomonadota bacterium]